MVYLTFSMVSHCLIKHQSSTKPVRCDRYIFRLGDLYLCGFGFFSCDLLKNKFRSILFCSISLPSNFRLILYFSQEGLLSCSFVPLVVSYLCTFPYTSSSSSCSNKKFPIIFHFNDQKAAFYPLSPTHFTSPTIFLALK